MSASDKVREIVTDVTGIEWPAGDVGKLRDIANAWRKFADDMEDVAAAANKAAQALIHNNKGEAISAFADPFWARYYHDKKGWLQDLVDGPRDLAKGIDKYADAVADAKKKLDHELEIAGATIAVGTGLAFFTFGISEAAAATATAAIVDLAATCGVALTTEVATIAGTAFATAAIAGIESVTVDLAVAQPLKIAAGLQGGFSLDEASSAATDGMLYGGLFGAAGSTAGVAADAGGFPTLFGGALRFNGPAIDQMGNTRYWKLFQSEDSKTPVPPSKPGDSELISGDPVYFGRNTTTVGYDGRTMNNLERVGRLPGVHDVIVHGTDQGVFLAGRLNAAGKNLTDFEVHPNHIVDAIRSNPNYHGEPVRLVSCYSGADTHPPELPLGQSVANELGVPVYAPTDRVGTDTTLGFNQTPVIDRNGYWRIYLPVAH
ncbi:hypothetical protein ACIBCO_40650 [Streptomyces violascens]|uniref:WXG100-like domain-containing protein n=1 Tax=Streptomyces violascens TaxID=67381 RepID=UPI00379DA8EF